MCSSSSTATKQTVCQSVQLHGHGQAVFALTVHLKLLAFHPLSTALPILLFIPDIASHRVRLCTFLHSHLILALCLFMRHFLQFLRCSAARATSACSLTGLFGVFVLLVQVVDAGRELFLQRRRLQWCAICCTKVRSHLELCALLVPRLGKGARAKHRSVGFAALESVKQTSLVGQLARALVLVLTVLIKGGGDGLASRIAQRLPHSHSLLLCLATRKRCKDVLGFNESQQEKLVLLVRERGGSLTFFTSCGCAATSASSRILSLHFITAFQPSQCPLTSCLGLLLVP